jgi:hypothetical protein
MHISFHIPEQIGEVKKEEIKAFGAGLIIPIKAI